MPKTKLTKQEYDSFRNKWIKDTKDTILDSVLDEAEGLLADGDSVGYFKGIELYSKLLTRFKKV